MLALDSVLPGSSPAISILRSDGASRLSNVGFVIVVALLTLHFPVQHFTGIPLHWVALFLFIPVALLQARVSHASALILAVYLLLVGVSALLSLRLLPARQVALGTLSYVLLPIPLFLGLQFDTFNRIHAVASANRWIALLAGMAAYYQLRFDKVLFGLYDGTKYQWLELWGAPRAASLFYSPQVYTAYMTFSVVLHDSVFRSERKFPGIFAAAIMAFALLGGSTSVIVGIGTYYLTKLVFRSWRPDGKSSPSVVGLLSAALITTAIYSVLAMNPASLLDIQGGTGQASPAERIWSTITQDGVGADANSSRIETWKNVIASTPVLLGNGIGSASTLVDGKNRVATESYILSLYYQGGVVLISAFAVLFGALFMQRLQPERLAFAGITALFAIIVPVYYAWSLPIVWVLLFGFIEMDDIGTTIPMPPKKFER